MADPKAPELPADVSWFCPQCGPLKWHPLTPEDEIAGVRWSIIDEDGCCSGCGCTACEWSELVRLLSAHGLHIVSEDERKVLDAAHAVAAQYDQGDMNEFISANGEALLSALSDAVGSLEIAEGEAKYARRAVKL